MNRIALIIKREFITRVRKKSFIIMSILGPLLFSTVMILPVWLAMRDTSSVKVIEVDDDSGLFEAKFEETGNLKFNYIDVDEDRMEITAHVLQSENYGLLHIPEIQLDDPSGITFYSKSNPSLEVKQTLSNLINKELEEMKLNRLELSSETLEQIRTNITLNTLNVTESGEKKGSSEVATVVGYVGALLIYFFIFLYGAQVMRGVIEEKSNRIVEVIISSVKPFQLMMGKIIGVASVGLAQFVLWVILTVLIVGGVKMYFNVDALAGQNGAVTTAMTQDDIEQAQNIQYFLDALNTVPFATIGIGFIFYFLGGYLLYGALFAAVGSAADSDTDTQQFMLPITIPLILSIVMLSVVLKEPDGSLAFWLSIIPLTSPIVMMMRLPFVAPAWEIILSMGLLILGFIFTTWLAGKIYRIGVLVHGAKVNYKVLAKWLFMKN